MGAQTNITNNKNKLALELAKPETKSQISFIDSNLSVLPQELRVRLCSILDSGDLLNLIIADSKNFLFYYAKLAQRPDFPLRKLLSHAALGEWDAARVIWSQNPAFFLTCRGTIYHPNPKVISSSLPSRPKLHQLTVWQIAWVNEEYDIVKEMAKFMTEEEQLKQFIEIFPDCKITKHHWDLEEARACLHDLFAAVTQDTQIYQNIFDMNIATRQAFNALNEFVKPNREHKIGLVFDTLIYVEALALYEQRQELFQNEHQRAFWCVRVEERLAGQMGTRILRKHARGISNKTEQMAGCFLADNSSYFAFRRDTDSIFGLHACVGNSGVTCAGQMAPRLPLQKNRWLESGLVYSLVKKQQQLAETFETEFSRKRNQIDFANDKTQNIIQAINNAFDTLKTLDIQSEAAQDILSGITTKLGKLYSIAQKIESNQKVAPSTLYDHYHQFSHQLALFESSQVNHDQLSSNIENGLMRK